MQAAILSLLTCAAIVSSIGTNYNVAELAALTPSGCHIALTACLSSAKISNPNAFAECYAEAGCSHYDPRLEPQLFSNHHNGNLEGSELRRREDTTTADSDTATDASTTIAEKTTEKSDKTTATEEKTTSEKTAAGTTTEEKTTSAPSSAAATTTAESTTSDSTTSTTSEASTAAATTSTTSTTTSSTSSDSVTSAVTAGTACSVTHTVSTSACSYTKNKMLGCTSTTTEIATCAPGYLCFSATAGADLCMKKENSLTTSGLVVTIAFGVGISAALISALAINMRSRSQAKRAAQVAAMMAPSRPVTRDVERSVVPSQRNQSEDNLPLIASSGGRFDQQQYGEVRGAPRLHQGLGALGQDQSPRY